MCTGTPDPVEESFLLVVSSAQNPLLQQPGLHSQEIAGPSLPDFDSAIARIDVEQLTSLLQSHSVDVANSNPIPPASQYKWSSAVQFVLDLANLQLNSPCTREEIGLFRIKNPELTRVRLPWIGLNLTRPAHFKIADQRTAYRSLS